MGLSVRARMLVWLLLVILPAVVVGWFTMGLIGDRLSDRVQVDLANIRRLEAARLSEALDDYVGDARSLAAGPHVVDFVAGVAASRTDGSAGTVGGYDGFDVVDPTADRPLAQLAAALQNKARSTGSEVVELRLVDIDQSTLGETEGFGWTPYDEELLGRVLAEGRPRFGNAYRSESGDDRLGLVTPIMAPDGAVLGALVLETNLGPVVDLVVEHEGFGQTSEAHIAQPTPAGDAEFITLLRFERDAAFNKIVPASTGLPIIQSLHAPEGEVLRSPDYRSVDSILAVETLEATGWGLVVKIDAAEAFAPVGEVRRALIWAGLVTLLVVIGCTAVLLNPLGRRLRRLSLAAKQVAAGRYQASIGDQSTDEIGVVARSIDQLAADLDADIQMRTIVETKLRHQVTHDDLTEIHNRHYATTRIEELSRTAASPWSLLFLDLDSFKRVNDTHGHGVGDEVLQAVAGRLSTAAPEGATVARWGGDEFVVVLPLTGQAAAQTVAEQTRQLFEHPVATSVGEQNVRCSIGVATADTGSGSLDDVLHQADSAMFAQKPQTGAEQRAWSSTERAVIEALHDDRIDVWFQPIVASDAHSTTIIGAEALVRLRTPDGQHLPPADFLPAVVDTRTGIDLDDHVARQAVRTCTEWLTAGLVTTDFQISVNLGSGSLADPELAKRFQNLLQTTRLPAQMLVVEISETADTINMSALRELTDTGINVALDDIGISHSNYDRLLQIKPHYAKIDRRWLTTNPDESLILQSLTKTCQALNLTMVAEGIETPAQYQLAQHLNIPYLQGFLFGQAIPKTEFSRTWLNHHPQDRSTPVDRSVAPRPASSARASG